MNIPILIVGYERTGTTILRRLVSMHPNLEYDLVHEKWNLLRAAKNKKHANQIMTFKATQNKKRIGTVSSIISGQKIPYNNFLQAQKYIDKFLSLFPEGHLMHIIRKPLETINSQVKTFDRNVDHCIKNYFDSVPRVYDYTKQLPNSCQISYENLIDKPKEVLADLYRWMGQEVDPAHIERVVSTQDPWEHNGRILPGLRYFNNIIPKKREIILKKEHIQAIESHSLQYETNF